MISPRNLKSYLQVRCSTRTGTGLGWSTQRLYSLAVREIGQKRKNLNPPPPQQACHYLTCFSVLNKNLFCALKKSKRVKDMEGSTRRGCTSLMRHACQAGKAEKPLPALAPPLRCCSGVHVPDHVQSLSATTPASDGWLHAAKIRGGTSDTTLPSRNNLVALSVSAVESPERLASLAHRCCGN